MKLQKILVIDRNILEELGHLMNTKLLRYVLSPTVKTHSKKRKYCTNTVVQNVIFSNTHSLVE